MDHSGLQSSFSSSFMKEYKPDIRWIFEIPSATFTANFIDVKLK